MNLLEAVISDVGDPPKGHLVRPFDIKFLGYRFSGNRMNIRDKDMNYVLCELIDEDTKRPVGFCFLLSKKTTMGLVLPFPYEKYSDVRKEDRREARKKTKNPSSKANPGESGDEEMA